jgi:hypothetical protein
MVKLLPKTRTPPPSELAELPLMVPPLMVKLPLLTYTPSAAELRRVEPAFITTAPLSRRTSAAFLLLPFRVRLLSRTRVIVPGAVREKLVGRS